MSKKNRFTFRKVAIKTVDKTSNIIGQSAGLAGELISRSYVEIKYSREEAQAQSDKEFSTWLLKRARQHKARMATINKK